MAAYVPDIGDIVWLEFDPQAGHEQAGHRPALVLSPAKYNGLRGMMICCPMTTRIKGYPFEVVESRDPPSVVLADQVKRLDWRARRATKKGKVSKATLADTQAKIRALLVL
ncbi:endoribonuclease MazF [Sphingomonadales bacterium 56]|uniref:endoribonuclease MazF n=1 Tax=unclassified Sphingobium TaxID=2611147 RepID=UPI00191A2116|nr:MULTISPECIES: endoribonuclease MazF [unclassified Sphingobium]MBY2930544.1 endoribonuclease MazF [Sphingomonadales bacterium 56]MBY2960976.1 endoribonuclease MazF [Sphingomonadales bacterium 58]CAD7341521.1 Endoribonuclease toxin MazF [Sphingobium sp. S6]CAD7342278.1 Endoribonuclease toxin MazF [Sphingobium sp. S8]